MVGGQREGREGEQVEGSAASLGPGGLVRCPDSQVRWTLACLKCSQKPAKVELRAPGFIAGCWRYSVVCAKPIAGGFASRWLNHSDPGPQLETLQLCKRGLCSKRPIAECVPVPRPGLLTTGRQVDRQRATFVQQGLSPSVATKQKQPHAGPLGDSSPSLAGDLCFMR